MATQKQTEELLSKAHLVLDNNWQRNHTMPAEGLYPHQWLWDSCFIAIGLSHFNLERAQIEILSLLKGQWSNGMIPNMIFAGHDEYARDRELWRSYVSPFSPDDRATTGITQPPMLAEAIYRVGKKLKKSERHAWYRQTYPALLKYHRWLYRERDPRKSGLVALFHPWESGMDSTPSWLEEIHRHLPWWVRLAKILHLDNTVSLVRRDVRMTLPGQRLSNLDALAFYGMQVKLRHKNYDTDRVLKSHALVLEDLAFNCILIRANHYLQLIAKALDKGLPASLSESVKRAPQALEALFDDTSAMYFSRNLRTGALVPVNTVATFLPLYAGCISQERAQKLVDLLNSSAYSTKYPLPSVPTGSPWFGEHRYWQGPVWINMNWLVADGLRRYGFDKEADRLTQSSVELIRKNGFFEYFSPKDGSPAGALNFSWSAALLIDFLS